MEPETNGTNIDKILARVKKMITLANDAAASEGERDNALRMAYATLAKYNLDMAQVEATSLETDPRLKLEAISRDFPWTRTVAYAVAQLFFCRYFYTRIEKGKNTHHFVGKKSNAITAQEISMYVIRSISSEAARRAREGHLDNGWQRDFAKGAAYVIHHRCHELRKQAEEPKQEQSPGTAIVLASVYKRELTANSDYLRQLGIHLSTGKSRERSAGSDGYSSGREFGSSVSLNRQVGGSSSSNRRLK